MASSSLLLLVDGHSVAYRAYHALPASIRDAGGRPAHALYGFLNILFRVLQDRAPSHAAVTLDAGRPFRLDLFDAYKAQRDASPADFEPQVVQLRDVLRAFGVPLFAVETYEADDLLATLVRQARAVPLAVDLLSGDLDILQLVGPDVRVVAPGKTFAEPVVYDAVRVRERYGIEPAQLRDWKALVGDASDAIPGVRGVGPKSATALLQRHGSLDGIFAQLASVEPARLRSLLAAGRDAAFASRGLVALHDDAPVVLDLDAARVAGFDRDRGAAALRALGFPTLAARLQSLGGAPAASDPGS